MKLIANPAMARWLWLSLLVVILDQATKWLAEAQMPAKFQQQGYRDDVKKLHVSKGQCWEIYGHDKQGRKVEIYFHPISGAIVQANVKG